MNKWQAISASMFWGCMLVAVGTAQADDYTITWKNNFASRMVCTFKETVTPVMGAAISDEVRFNFSSIGQTKTTTVSSLTCSSIHLSASCSYSDSKGDKKGASFTAATSCGNSQAVMNPTLPPSLTVTLTQKTPQGVLSSW